MPDVVDEAVAYCASINAVVLPEDRVDAADVRASESSAHGANLEPACTALDASRVSLSVRPSHE